MKRLLITFFIMSGWLSSYSQVRTILLDAKDRITQDSTQAATYGAFGKIDGDSVYTFKKFDFDGTLLMSGSFRDDSLQVPHGKFVYYEWIVSPYNNIDQGYEYNGRARYVAISGVFINGNRNGRWLGFYPDGKVKQLMTYVRGVLHGVYQYMDTDGKVQISGQYISGKKNGTWILRGGKQEDEYVDDKLISSLSGKKLRDKQAQRKNIE